MTEFLDRTLEERIRNLVADEVGDWLDVRRRAGTGARRRRRIVFAIAAALVLLIAVPAFGIGERLLQFLSLEPSKKPLPSLRAQGLPPPYIIDRKLFQPGQKAITLAAPLRAPLLGQDAPLAVPSPVSKLIAYETWNGGSPQVRLHDVASGEDVPLETGTQSAAWRADGALAYWRAAGPLRPAQPFLGAVLVRMPPSHPSAVWLSRPGPYVVSGWARDHLLVTVDQCLACPSTLEPGVLALDGPERVRRLGLRDISAISPDGRYVVGGFDAVPGQDSPSSLLRVVEVATGRVVSRLDLRQAADASVPARWLAAGIGPGSWAGNRIVATTAAGNVGALVVMRFSRARLTVERIIRLDRAAALPPGYGPFFSVPIFLERTGRRVALAVSVPPRRGGSGFRSFLQCDLSAAHCVRGRSLPQGSWMGFVYDPSRPRPHR